MAEAKDFTAVGTGWMGDLPDICTVQEVAQYLRESISRVRLMVKRGEFPHAWRAHKGYRIPRSDVYIYTEKMYGHRSSNKNIPYDANDNKGKIDGPDPDDPDAG